MLTMSMSASQMEEMSMAMMLGSRPPGWLNAFRTMVACSDSARYSELWISDAEARLRSQQN